MTSPVVEGIHKAEARSSVEVHDSCNNCFPRWCCGRKHKHIKRRDANSDLSVVVAKADTTCKSALQIVDPLPKSDSIEYKHMPALPGASK